MRLGPSGLLAPLVALAVAASWVTVGAVAQAAPSAPVLRASTTVTGTGSTYTTVRLTRPVHLPDGFHPTVTSSSPAHLVAVVLAKELPSNSAPGVALVRLHQDPALNLAVQYFGTDNGDAVSGNPVYLTGTLPAGTYRLYLLSHGANTVTFTLPGLPAGSLRVRATRATTYAVAESTPPGLTGQALVPQSTTATTFTSRYQPLMLALGWARTTSAAAQAYACATQDPPAGDPTEQTPYCPDAGIADVIAPAVDEPSYFDAWYQPAAGRWQFKNVWAFEGVVTHGGGWVLQLDLGAGYPRR
jgi:hypothetical protein